MCLKKKWFCFFLAFLLAIGMSSYSLAEDDFEIDYDEEDLSESDLDALKPDSGNAGHRAGYRSYITIPENSLEAVRMSLGGEAYPGQFASDFKYLEFDVRETYDNQLVIFHDSKIKRMLPNTAYNKAIFDEFLRDPSFVDRMKKVGNKKLDYKKIRVRHLTLEEIQRFHLKGSAKTKVPSFTEFLHETASYKIKKPVAVEVKDIFSDQARDFFHRTLEEYYSNVILHNTGNFDSDLPPLIVIAFKKSFKSSFGSSTEAKNYWCDRLRATGAIGVFQCRTSLRVNLCDKY